MSIVQQGICLTTIATFFVSGCGQSSPESTDDAVPATITGIAVYSFVPLDSESEKMASELTNTLIESLKKTNNISVLSSSELPPNMQDPSNHDRWPESDLVSLILEGSVKKTESRTMVTAQLIDSSSDEHVWADTYVFDQGDVARIVSAVEDQVLLAANR